MDSEADYAKENDDQENQKSNAMNSIVAKYREKQQAALDAATREAQLIRERSTDLSPSKGSGSESRSESKSPEKETKRVSDKVAEPVEVEEKIPEPVEEETKSEEALEPEPEPVVEKEKEPEVEKVQGAPVEANEPLPIPEIELESSQDSQDETAEGKEPLEKEQAEKEKDGSKEESEKEEDKRSESNSRSRSSSPEPVREEQSSPEKRATPAEAGDGDYLELDYEEESKAEATEKDITEKEKSESEVQSPKEGDLDNERPKQKTPYVEDRFDFLKKISASEPETKETTEYGLVRANPPSPARHDVDLFIHIHRLRRPFTNKGLIALLKKFGEFDENADFWIDAIKSNCIVKYSSIEEAQKAREELHNVIWPTGNPDCLLVDFCTEDRFIEKKVGKVEKKKEVKPEESIRVEVETAPVEHHEPPTTSEEKNGGEESRERKRTPTRQKSEKGLDELFKKTNAKPFIYYLPLSTEEAERKWADRKALEEKRRHRETPPIRSRPTPSRRRSPPPRRRRSISRSPERKRDRRASPPRRR